MTFKDLVLNRKLKGPGTCKTTRTGMINREKEKGWAGGHIKNESKIHNSRILEKNNIKNKQQKYTDKNLWKIFTIWKKGREKWADGRGRVYLTD